MQVNQVVKVKTGRWARLVGVVEEVCDGGAVMVRIEGVRDSVPFVVKVRQETKNLEVKG